MKGFQKALQAYETKLTDPFGGADYENEYTYDDYLADQYDARRDEELIEEHYENNKL